MSISRRRFLRALCAAPVVAAPLPAVVALSKPVSLATLPSPLMDMMVNPPMICSRAVMSDLPIYAGAVTWVDADYVVSFKP